MNEVSDSSTDPRKKNVPYSNVAVVRDTEWEVFCHWPS